MLESIEHLAHSIQQTTRWGHHNQAPTEEHFTQIMQAALNMPRFCSTGNDLGWDHKGLVLWAPHRSDQFDGFRDVVLSATKCNLDWNFKHLKATLVFMLTPSEPCPQSALAVMDHKNYQKDLAERQVYWSQALSRAKEHHAGYSMGNRGDQFTVPDWLCQYLMTATLALSASALQARQLGYHVQFLNLQRVSIPMLTHFGDVCNGRPYMPFVAMNVGTHADQRHMSLRRNRTYGKVTHTDHTWFAENGMADDPQQPVGTEWSDELISTTQNQFEHRHNYYRKLAQQQSKKGG
jgi:hypothetical protein